MTDFATARTMMVDCQVRPSDVTRYPIINAMLTVRREAFVPRDLQAVAYAGEHVPLGSGRVLLDPRSFAKMLDALEIGPADLVLDIGCGLGYSTAVIARLAEAVVGVEEDADMAAEATSILSAEGADNAAVAAAALTAGDPAHGPFDVIMIEGGVDTVPVSILDQLKEGGRIGAIFIAGRTGCARVGVKSGGRVHWRDVFDATAPTLPGFERAPAFEF